MKQGVASILKRFGLNAGRVSKPADAMLAQVYAVEDRYILRSRSFEPSTLERFAAECELCGHVAQLTGFRFPAYRRSASGTRYAIEDNNFWTLHERIPGRPLGSWFELHRIDPSITLKVVHTLRRLHTGTTGCFDEKRIDRTHLLASVNTAHAEALDFLSGNAVDRLNTAVDRVKIYCDAYTPEAVCFVHGDFHHGNILALNDRITGFIDLDWCRIGSPCEDLAFTLMMLLRDYDNWSPAFRWPVYREMLRAYDFQGDTTRLNDFIILYALFDCDVFKHAQFDNARAFFEYQKRFLEGACNALGRE